MMLNAGTGSVGSVTPAMSAMYFHSGLSCCSAPALHRAIDTARIEFAPSLPFVYPHSLSEPSSSFTIIMSNTD